MTVSLIKRHSDTGMHHSWRVAAFAFSCLLADIRTQRKR